jgi:hypothetical protein
MTFFLAWRIGLGVASAPLLLLLVGLTTVFFSYAKGDSDKATSVIGFASTLAFEL